MNQENILDNNVGKFLIKCSDRYERDNYKWYTVPLKILDFSAIISISIFLTINRDKEGKNGNRKT